MDLHFEINKPYNSNCKNAEIWSLIEDLSKIPKVWIARRPGEEYHQEKKKIFAAIRQTLPEEYKDCTFYLYEGRWGNNLPSGELSAVVIRTKASVEALNEYIYQQGLEDEQDEISHAMGGGISSW